MKAKNVGKCIMLVLLCLAMVASLCACGSKSDDSNTVASFEAQELSENEAIAKAKNCYGLGNEIATELGFKQYADPQWGVCNATKTSDGWRVSLKGKMTGYTDEYREDIEVESFEAIVEVSNYGSTEVQTVYRR